MAAADVGIDGGERGVVVGDGKERRDREQNGATKERQVME